MHEIFATGRKATNNHSINKRVRQDIAVNWYQVDI
jgi:hypothetical protein